MLWLQGILTLDGRRAVSALIFNVFSPCLFFSSLGAGEGVAEAVRLWPLTVNMVLSNAIGLLLGAALIKLARVPLELHKHMLVAVAVGPGVAKLPARVIASVILCRLVLLPLCGTPLVALPFKAGWFGDIHPMAVVVMLVTNATPTAIIVHAIATMYRNREDDLAALLFWEYLASIVSLPLLTALFLHIAAPG
ncbi:uncharacterized protein HaLaN_10702 [Haematococcus lacustris]|uniref:Auxin efflux carrier n=1 Tax=Haematococcus lacustris TaxID=44745 RepID=A0A699ZG87_HAELA|nr:uncharacterized protein HaLaN_10702 [Haematococcus lacustris]